MRTTLKRVPAVTMGKRKKPRRSRLRINAVGKKADLQTAGESHQQMSGTGVVVTVHHLTGTGVDVTAHRHLTGTGDVVTALHLTGAGDVVTAHHHLTGTGVDVTADLQ